MAYEQVWMVILIPALFAGVAFAVWARHLKETKRVAKREMLHRERMAALEQGVALPELAEGSPNTGQGAGNGRGWVAQAALLAGLTLLFGGVGFVAAFYFTPSTPETVGMRELAPMGFIPAFAGLGLLIFYVLDRRTRRHAGE